MSQRILTPDQLQAADAYSGHPSERFALGDSVEVEQFGRWTAGEVSVPPATHHRISTHVQADGNKARSRWTIDGQRFDVDLEPALVAVVPAGHAVDAAWDATANGTVNFLFTQETLVRILEESGVRFTSVEVLPGIQGLDPALLEWSNQLMSELHGRRLGGGLMQESLKLQMLIHILRHYTNQSDYHVADAVGRRDRLRSKAMSNVLEYMHAHLDQRIGLEALARVAGVSRFHFSRLFKQALGHTPTQELNRLRVERAKQLIRRDGRFKPLAAIAGECGFADQSHMGRHFKRLVGVTPGAFLHSP